MTLENVTLALLSIGFVLTMILAPLTTPGDPYEGMGVMPQNLPAVVSQEYIIGCEKACGCFVHAPAYNAPE